MLELERRCAEQSQARLHAGSVRAAIKQYHGDTGRGDGGSDSERLKCNERGGGVAALDDNFDGPGETRGGRGWGAREKANPWRGSTHARRDNRENAQGGLGATLPSCSESPRKKSNKKRVVEVVDGPEPTGQENNARSASKLPNEILLERRRLNTPAAREGTACVYVCVCVRRGAGRREVWYAIAAGVRRIASPDENRHVDGTE